MRQSSQKNDGSVTGIHFKVKKHFQIIKYGIADIVRFINDNDRRLSFFKGKSGHFVLDDLKVIRFTESWLCS